MIIHKQTHMLMLLISLILLLLVLGSSCVVTEQLTFNSSGYNASKFDFTVEDFFIAVLEDFSEFAPEEQEASLMDSAITDFDRALKYSSTTNSVAMYKLTDNAYKGQFNFMDLDKLFSDLGAGKEQSLLRQSNNTLTFNLSMDNYDQLVPVIPFLADENFEAFGPVYNQGLGESDYLEMISFMLGEEGPPAIEASTITLRIATPKPIKGFTNGRKVGPSLYEFSFPLIDFLLLAKPITFSVSW
ncbi:MAG TPA: hypothetical protein VJ854_07535 [Sphaerochaeta sp.]|nr:hypothetical protein [Sphaerochaeta sp.]